MLVDLTSKPSYVSLRDLRDAGHGALVWVTPDQMLELYNCLAAPPPHEHGLQPLDFYGVRAEVHPTYAE